MNDLAGRKAAGGCQAIEAVGATAFSLPPDGPDLDPIERAFMEITPGVVRQTLRPVLGEEVPKPLPPLRLRSQVM